MSKKPIDDGGHAFPQPERKPDGYVDSAGFIHRHQSGMSLRDYFAGQALGGLASADASIQAIVRDSYRIADAMLKERSRPQ